MPFPKTSLPGGLNWRTAESACREPLDFAEAIQDAGKFALIRRNAPAKTLDMHRQVQEVLKDEMDPPDPPPLGRAGCCGAMRHLSCAGIPELDAVRRASPARQSSARHIADFGLDSHAGHLLNQTASTLMIAQNILKRSRCTCVPLSIYEKALGRRSPSQRHHPQ